MRSGREARHVEDPIERLYQEGRWNSAGTFQLDLERSARRFGPVQKANPAFFLLKLIQAAVAGGASRLEMSLSDHEIEVEFPLPFPSPASARHLHSALLAAHTVTHKQLTLSSQELVSLRLTRKRSLRLWPSHWLTCLLSGLERCWLGPIPITINGRIVNCPGSDRLVRLPRYRRRRTANDPLLDCLVDYVELVRPQDYPLDQLMLAHPYARRARRQQVGAEGADQPGQGEQPYTALNLMVGQQATMPHFPAYRFPDLACSIQVYWMIDPEPCQLYIQHRGVLLNPVQPGWGLPGFCVIVPLGEVLTDAEELTPIPGHQWEELRQRLESIRQNLGCILERWLQRPAGECRSLLGMDPECLGQMLSL